MRVSEVTRLLITDLDSGRMVIRVDQGKGRKDRYVMLSPSLLETLRAYWRESKPKVFLFPGVGGNKPLCISAAQKAFGRARLQAGIKKPVSYHTLRHSFATHLVESGTSVRTIQALLGHRSLQTTERYTHLGRTTFIRQQAPSIGCERRRRHPRSSWRTARQGSPRAERPELGQILGQHAQELPYLSNEEARWSRR